MTITTDQWPLSAAATAVLLNVREPASTILKLAIKELVVVGMARLERLQTSSKRRAKTSTVLHLGDRPVPERMPLPRVAAALFAGTAGGPLREVVAAAVRKDRRLADKARADVLQDLVDRGLVVVDKRWYRTKVTRTTEGDSLAALVLARHAQWGEAMDTGGPAAAAAIVAATSAPGLILLMDNGTLMAIDAALRRARGAGDDRLEVTIAGEATERVQWADLECVDGLSGIDGAVDACVDAGSSDGGGGDGGGGGD